MACSAANEKKEASLCPGRGAGGESKQHVYRPISSMLKQTQTWQSSLGGGGEREGPHARATFLSGGQRDRDRLQTGSVSTLLLLLGRSVVSGSLWPRGPQRARPPCPSPAPRVRSDPRPLSQRWRRPTVLSSVIPSLPLPPSVPPSVRVFFNESALHIRWPKCWSFSSSISPSSEYSGMISSSPTEVSKLPNRSLTEIWHRQDTMQNKSWKKPIHDLKQGLQWLSLKRWLWGKNGTLRSICCPQQRGLGPHIRTEAGQEELLWKTRASHFEQLPFNLGSILFHI